MLFQTLHRWFLWTRLNYKCPGYLRHWVSLEWRPAHCERSFMHLELAWNTELNPALALPEVLEVALHLLLLTFVLARHSEVQRCGLRVASTLGLLSSHQALSLPLFIRGDRKTVQRLLSQGYQPCWQRSDCQLKNKALLLIFSLLLVWLHLQIKSIHQTWSGLVRILRNSNLRLIRCKCVTSVSNQ